MSHYLSPSLLSTGQSAYEVKFLVSEAQSTDILGWAIANLEMDPHGDPETAYSYETTTLYLDTKDHKVFHATDGYKTEKMRVRAYSMGDSGYLELKRKRSNRVSKVRTKINLRDLKAIGDKTFVEEASLWFTDRIEEKLLQPVCQVSYVRNAFSGVLANSPVRLTLDHSITGTSQTHWALTRGPKPQVEVLLGQRILEIKFQTVMPSAFKVLIRDLGLVESKISKYRKVMSVLQGAEVELCKTG